MIQALGTPAAPRAVMDAFHPELLGVLPPHEVQRALESFQAAWGVQALQGAPADALHGASAGAPPISATGPDGQALQVRIALHQGRILSWRILLDERPVLVLAAEGLVLADPPPPPEPERPSLQRGAEGQATVQVQGLSYKGTRDTLAFERSLDALLDAVQACPRTAAGSISLRIEPAEGTTPVQVNHQGTLYDLELSRCAREALAPIDMEGGQGAVELQLLFGVPAPGGP